MMNLCKKRKGCDNRMMTEKKGKSNYDTMRDRMKLRFLEYDQEAMIRKFQLKSDADYLYLSFVGRPYRISRQTGVVEWSEDGFQTYLEAGFNEAMTIFDVLCDSKENCSLSGKFCTVNMLPGIVQSAQPGGFMFRRQAERFTGRTADLAAACQQLGGTPERVGDVSYRLALFDFLPLIFQFWDADDEFPPSLNLLWDRKLLDFMHYETSFFAAGHLFRRLREMMDGEKR